MIKEAVFQTRSLNQGSEVWILGMHHRFSKMMGVLKINYHCEETYTTESYLKNGLKSMKYLCEVY